MNQTRKSAKVVGQKASISFMGIRCFFKVKPSACKEIRIPKSRKFLAVNPAILVLESGIPLTIGIRNPSFTEKESGILYLESAIHALESQSKSRLDSCP